MFSDRLKVFKPIETLYTLDVLLTAKLTTSYSAELPLITPKKIMEKNPFK